MTTGQSRRFASRLRPSPDEIAEDIYDALPTRLYQPDDRTSAVLRAAARTPGWPSPSSYVRAKAPTLPAPRTRANAPTLAEFPSFPSRRSRPSPLATFNLPRGEPREARISQMLRDLPYVATVDASRPLTYALANPFLGPPAPDAPPPMWGTHRRATTAKRVSSRRRRRSILPLVTAVAAIALALGLWHDDVARAEVVSALERAAAHVSVSLR